MTPTAWKVHKFGGSSVADADCFRRVAHIVESDPAPRVAVVLSAARGVTDRLLGMVAAAERRDRAAYDAALDEIAGRHAGMAEELLGAEGSQTFLAGFGQDVEDIRGILQTVSLIRSAGERVRDLVAGFGEIWSTRLFTAFLQARAKRAPVSWIDARECLVVEWGPLGPGVQWELSQERAAVRGEFARDGLLVITGFIAVDPQGLQTTLGRNGSDYSASIFGALLGASEIVIWTDVDGVLSADPRRVPEARLIEALSYNEAMELAYFGAKVIHPQTMAPAVERRIPIRIRNTFAPEGLGTVICERAEGAETVKGITSIDAVALVNVEDAGMIGVPGTAQRLFGALRDEDISVILISQGSSEHSICFAIPETQAALADRVLRRAFSAELRENQIQSVEVSAGCAIIAVVGDGMAGKHGVAAMVFDALGWAGVNVKAIAQGASERNISAVIGGEDVTRALRAVHAAFYLSPNTLSIGVLGPGTVGSVLLDQLSSQVARLKQDFNVDLRVRAIAGSRNMLLAEPGVDLARWRELMKDGQPTDLKAFESHVVTDHLPHSVIIDCTADDDVASHYAGWLARGVHVVTPNKKANSGSLAYYRQLREARRQSGAHFLYEATVGAGLPIVTTLRDLRDTGDEVRLIEGIFSGTLAYLFNVFDGSKAFSSIVHEAKNLGYTEPDPRDDLSGTDVARKLIILGREIGLQLEMEDVEVESLVPEALRACSADEFMDRLGEVDGPMARLHAEAAAAGEVLRYVGRLTADGRATVGIQRLSAAHPFAHLALTDNIVRFVTARYADNALIVQGPGAGPAVTAGGVFGDLLRLAAYLGARL
ncbi:MAG: bifunctional aspartate kinase/homoserine dehydrogenase I [Steroidobacteraceae bacterium]